MNARCTHKQLQEGPVDDDRTTSIFYIHSMTDYIHSMTDSSVNPAHDADWEFVAYFSTENLQFYVQPPKE